MALNRIGRTIALDAPGTYDNIFPDKTAVFVDSIKLIADGADAKLELFADATSGVVAERFGELVAEAAAAVVASDELVLPGVDAIVSNNGLSAILTGAGSRAYIYIA